MRPADVAPHRLVEDGADRRGNHLLCPLRHQRERITHEMGSAPLPARSLKYRRDRGFETLVRITGDEFDAAEATRDQTAQEGVPHGTVFEFTMDSADSKIYPGIAREANTFGTADPSDPAKLVVTTSHPAPYTRHVAV